MTHEEYLSKIRSNPNDDLPRLSYANWLTLNGDPRGEFIRVQCILANSRQTDPDREGLLSQQQRLLNEYESRWIATLGDDIVYARFHRGFVESIRLRLRGTEQLDKLYESNLVSCISGMNVRSSRCGDNLASTLTRSHWASSFVDLDLDSTAITSSGIEAILGSNNLRGVRRLILSNNNFGSEGIVEFTRVATLPNLNILNIMETNAGDRGIAALGASRCVDELTILDARHNHIGPKGMEAIGASKRLHRLTTLLLEMNDIGNSGMRALVESATFSLLELGANWNDIGDDAIVVLANSPMAASLISLDLRGNRVTDEGLKALAESEKFVNLKKLLISANPAITSSGKVAFATNSKLDKLEFLAIDCLDDKSGIAFAKSPSLPSLCSLDIRTSELSEGVVDALEDRFADFLD